MRKLRILHLASFSGNIGDTANHRGFYERFKKVARAEFTPLEIRKFYKNRAEMRFDDEFVKLVNSYDLFVMGGGGFFDLKWDYSTTGTTIDLSPELIAKIKVPVLVNAMGYHEYGDVNPENVAKFKRFLTDITSRPNWFVSVRNDGSFDRMKVRYGDLVDKVTKTPDAGFFYEPKFISKKDRSFFTQTVMGKKETVWIGLNLTNELFNPEFNKSLTVESFNTLTAEFINKTLAEDPRKNIMLFTHAYQDIHTLDTVLTNVNEKYKRERIAIAPFFAGEKSIDQVFDLYNICSCVIGMRFHTNVCSIAMNIPTIGLASHEQICGLYGELGIPERVVKLDNAEFGKELSEKIEASLKNQTAIQNQYRVIQKNLKGQGNMYGDKVNAWLKSALISS